MARQLQQVGLRFFLVILRNQIVEDKQGLSIVVAGLLQVVALLQVLALLLLLLGLLPAFDTRLVGSEGLNGVFGVVLEGLVALLLHHADPLHLLLVGLVVNVELDSVVSVASHHLMNHVLALFIEILLLNFLNLFFLINLLGEPIPLVLGHL